MNELNEKDTNFLIRNSAIADKPHDAFVQMQWCGWLIMTETPILYVLTMLNLVVLR